jgi:methionyl-tRNA formyltransferase
VRLLLTAGFDRALHVIALGELARRGGHEIAGVLVVSPFRLRRLRNLIRRRGAGFALAAGKRLLGVGEASRRDALTELLEREGIVTRSLRSWSAASRIPYRVVASLNERTSIDAARHLQVDGVLYGGGGILAPAFLDAVGAPVLNAHSGPLPEVRGMHACEWSLLLGARPTVTIHFIDEGLDTGPVVESIPVEVRPEDTVESLRARCAALGVEGLLRAIAHLRGPWPSRSAHPAKSRQCFVLAPVLRDLLDAQLAEHAP